MNGRVCRCRWKGGREIPVLRGNEINESAFYTRCGFFLFGFGYVNFTAVLLFMFGFLVFL